MKEAGFLGFRRIIFWQYIPSPHQMPTLESFAKLLTSVEVLLVCDQQMDEKLLELGWQSVEESNLNVIVNPKQYLVNQLADEDPLSTLHVLNGLYYVTMVKQVYKRLLLSGAKFGLLSEGREYPGFKGQLRVLQSCLSDLQIAKKCDFVLAMGDVGITWYRRVGYPKAKLFEYIYTPPVRASTVFNPRETTCFVLLFVGRLEARKRVDLLFRAIAESKINNITVRLIGAGVEEHALKMLAAELNIQDQIEWLGVMPNDALGVEYFNADILVLPSRWDGWGAVVNEALLAGTPVLVSDRCGAGSLLKASDDQIGTVFQSGSRKQLTACIEKRIALGKVSVEQRLEISRWAKERIAGPAVAQYLKDILRFVYASDKADCKYPIAPWVAAYDRAEP